MAQGSEKVATAFVVKAGFSELIGESVAEVFTSLYSVDSALVLTAD
jgi:hypothetical protein